MGGRFARLAARVASALALALALAAAPGVTLVALAEPEAPAPDATVQAAPDAPEAQDASAKDEEADKGDAPAKDGTAAKGKDAKKLQITPAAERKKIAVTVRFVGKDEQWASYDGITLYEGASAWDATKAALTESGMAYRTGTEATQDVIVQLTRASGETLEFDSALGSGWHLYLDGERCRGSSSTVVVKGGSVVEWRYEVGTIMVTVSVVGPGGTGDAYWVAPTSVRVEASESAWDASLAVFGQSGYSRGRLLSYAEGADGSVVLDSIAALGENGITGEVWKVFVNGQIPATNVADVALRAGDSICWYYAGRGITELPSFVSATGAASQNPATAVMLEGIARQAWAMMPGTSYLYAGRVDCLSGIMLVGQDQTLTLVMEGRSLAQPLALLMRPTGWDQSLAHTLESRLRTGQGGHGAMGLDKSFLYVDGTGNVVKLALT